MRLVRLDDGRVLRVDAEAMASYGLAAGAPVADDVLAHLEARDAYARAREIAVRLLAIRPRSTAELRARLRQRCVAEEHIREVLGDLAASGYLDDLAFSRGWVTSRIASRPCGFGRLRRELREKGIAPETIEQAIREVFGEEDLPAVEERSARALLARRAAAFQRVPPEKRLRRVAGFLQRRGFAPGTIARVLRTTNWSTHRTTNRTGLAERSEEQNDGVRATE
jgi:regulatory protein